MKKKILIFSIVFFTVVSGVFAHSLRTVSPFVNVSYDKRTMDKIPLSIGVDGDIDRLALSVSVNTTTAFNSIGADFFIGGVLGYTNPNENFLKTSLLFGANADFGIKSKNVSINPYGRVVFSYTTPFNLYLKLSCDLGYTFNLNNTSQNGFNVRAGFSLGWSFDVGEKLIKQYDNRYDDLYSGNKKRFSPLDTEEAKKPKKEKTEEEIQKEIEREEQAEEFNESIANEFFEKIGNDEVIKDDADIIGDNRDKSTQKPISNSRINGAIVRYIYNRSSLYTVFLSPLNITDIRLQDKEEVVSIVLGDVDNWNAETIQTSESIDNEDRLITHVLLRPLNINIQTDCMIVTDVRVYYLKLFSTPTTYMTALEWIYPTSTSSVQVRKTKDAEISSTISDLDNLNFNYVIKGENGYKPSKVFSDTKRTFIQFSNDFYTSSYAPVPYLEDTKGERSLINFTQRGITYTVPLILKNGEKIVLLFDGKDMASIEREY